MNRVTVTSAAAEAFLVERFGDGVSEVSPAGEGEWSRAFAFRRARYDYVVRFGPQRDDFEKDRLAASYSSPALPIPQVVDIGEAFDGFYAISERISGRFIDELDGGQLGAVLPSLFRALDEARRAPLPSTTAGFGVWDATGDAPHRSWRDALLDIRGDRPADRTHGWREQMAASPIGCGPFDEAFDELGKAVAVCPNDRHLIHSDLLHSNVFVDQGRISGVIDWGCAMYGDFLYDIAWFTFWAPWYPAWRGMDLKAEARRHYETVGLDVPNFEERLRCYEMHIGLAGQAYQAFAGRWDDLKATARQTLEVAKAASGDELRSQ